MMKKVLVALAALALSLSAGCGGGSTTEHDGDLGDSPVDVQRFGVNVQEAITHVMFDMELIGIENNGIYREPDEITEPDHPDVSIALDVAPDGSKYVITGRYAGLETTWVYDSDVGKTVVNR